MTRARRDLLMGLLLLAFAVAFYVLTYHFRGQEILDQARDVGPTFLPRILLVALGVQAVCLVAYSLARKTEPSVDGHNLKHLWQARPALMFAAFLVYAYLATILGYVLSTLAFLVLSFFLLGVRKIWQLVVIPPAITLAVYYLFENVLGVWLPSGVFS